VVATHGISSHNCVTINNQRGTVDTKLEIFNEQGLKNKKAGKQGQIN